MKKHSGIMVPLLSPFSGDGKTDMSHLEKLLHFVISRNCQPFVLGTTGEGTSIPEAEKEKIVKMAVGSKGKNLKVYACVTGNCLENTVESMKRYADAGVDAVVAPLPSYYPLSDSGMILWYEALAKHSPCPLLLYNIPATTHMSIPVKVADLLSRHPNIEGIKDSERSEIRLFESLKLWKDREDFSHLMGWAGKSLEALAGGSDGLVPSSANLIPGVYDKMFKAASNNQPEQGMEMQKISDETGEIYQNGRSLSGSIAALKVLAASMGLCQPFVLPPLEQITGKEAEQLVWRLLNSFT